MESQCHHMVTYLKYHYLGIVLSGAFELCSYKQEPRTVLYRLKKDFDLALIFKTLSEFETAPLFLMLM
jgi:hypothetical protein